MKRGQMAKKSKTESNSEIEELTRDIQRIRADFENYRKNADSEKERARNSGRRNAIMALLPVIDNIERATANRPKELEGNSWADGIDKIVKNLEKSLSSLELKRIEASNGMTFDPSLHEAVQFDSESEDGEQIIAEELRTGYRLGDDVIRHTMVRVTTKS